MLDLCKEVGQEVPLVLPALCCVRQVMWLLWIHLPQLEDEGHDLAAFQTHRHVQS